MATFNSFLLRAPRGSELSLTELQRARENGWALCPRCDQLFAAFLEESHTKACKGWQPVNPNAEPWMP